MTHEARTTEQLARATLGQINSICDGAEDFKYEPHPLLRTQDTSCIVKIEPTTIRGKIQSGAIHFSFLDKEDKGDITEAEIELSSSGRVEILSEPLPAHLSEEKRKRIHYVQEFIFPLELMEAIIARPADRHELTTNILATESLQYFIDTSYRNRHRTTGSQ